MLVSQDIDRNDPRLVRDGAVCRDNPHRQVSLYLAESCASLAEISIIFGLNYKPELWIYNPNTKDRVQK